MFTHAGESAGIPIPLADLLQKKFSMLDALWCNLVYFFFLFLVLSDEPFYCLFYLDTQYLDTYNSSIFGTLLQWLDAARSP